MDSNANETAADDAAQENLKAVRLHYDAFASRDVDALVAGLDPKVVISIRDEHGRSAGEPIRGRDGARAFFEDIHAAVANPTVEIERLRADGNKVLAQVSLGGTLRDQEISGAIPAVHLFTVIDGLICEIRTHRPDWHAYDPEDL